MFLSNFCSISSFSDEENIAIFFKNSLALFVFIQLYNLNQVLAFVKLSQLFS